jgi:hypothetical protein
MTSTVLAALAVLKVSIEMPVTAAVFAFYLVGHGAEALGHFWNYTAPSSISLAWHRACSGRNAPSARPRIGQLRRPQSVPIVSR